MSEIAGFEGFFEETVDFFNNLKKNNNKKWFDRHKKDYETFILQPARAFVVAMGVRLKIISSDILAVPKANMSLFRIYRDTRFSPDKSRYKTHMGIFFWEGDRPRMECSGFYFHLEPPKLLLAGGIYMLPRYLIDIYRRSVVDPEYGAELSDILNKVKKIKDCKIGGKHYKRIPTGYDPSHPNAELLLHNGLYAFYETKIPGDFFTRKIINYCWEKFHPLAPLHKWLVSMSNRRYPKVA